MHYSKLFSMSSLAWVLRSKKKSYIKFIYTLQMIKKKYKEKY